MRKFLRVTFLWVLLAPSFTAFLGTTLNQLVIVANHDRFPVMVNDAKLFESGEKLLGAAMQGDDKAATQLEERRHGFLDDTHCVMTSKTHLNFLGDIFDFHNGIYSIGDLLLFVADEISTFCRIAWFVLVLCSLTNKLPETSPRKAVARFGRSDTPAPEPGKIIRMPKVSRGWDPSPQADGA